MFSSFPDFMEAPDGNRTHNLPISCLEGRLCSLGFSRQSHYHRAEALNISDTNPLSLSHLEAASANEQAAPFCLSFFLKKAYVGCSSD
jgi:hypothetical protein